MLLLLSTCRNHAATFNACACEVHSWIRHHRYNFDQVLSVLEAVDWRSAEDAVEGASRAPDVRQLALRFDTSDDARGQDTIRRRAQSFDQVCGAPRLSTVIYHCREYLSEFEHKRRLFFEEFDHVAQSFERYCCRDSYGSVFWEESISRTDFLSAAKDDTVVPRFRALEVAEKLAWCLIDFVEHALGSHGLWVVGGPDVARIKPHDLPRTAEVYNAMVDFANSQQYGPWIHHRLPNPSADATKKQHPMATCVKAARNCFGEIRRFFDLWIPLYEPNAECPFLPQPGKARFRGFDERLLRSNYLLFIDIINSKLCPPDVKTEIQTALRSVQRSYHTEMTGNDAYLIVTEHWSDVLAIVKLLSVRTATYRGGTPFGGLRCSVAFGDCMERVFEGREQDDPILMDLSGEPCIPVAAYLNGQVKNLLERAGLGNDQSRWIVVDRHAAESIAKSTQNGSLEAVGFRQLGEWTYKGVLSTAFGIAADSAA